jgi:hypothetical protein
MRLREILPPEYWKEINGLLVTLGAEYLPSNLATL